MVIHNYGISGFFHLKERVISYITFTYNFYPPWQQGVVWASWTLGVEMVFYALFPMVWKLTRSVRSATGFLGASLIASWIIQLVVYHVMDEIWKAESLRNIIFMVLTGMNQPSFLAAA